MERTKRSKETEIEKAEFSERRIIIGLITNTDYIKQIRKVWETRLLESITARKIATWCIEYYDKYQKSDKQRY